VINISSEKERFFIAAQKFVEKLNSRHVKVRSIIVGGSILRSDFVPGFSDIDIYVFVGHKDIDSQFFIILREVLSDVKKETGVDLRPDVFYVEDLQTLLNRRVSVNELVEKRLVIHGEDVFKDLKHGDLLRVAQRTIAFDEEVIRRMLYLSAFDANLLKRAIKICISVAKVCLFFKGIYLLNKEEIIRNFKEQFPEFSRHFNTLEKAYQLRMNFSSLRLDETEIAEFVLKVYEFLRDARLYFHITEIL